jgi:hypothetical protein
MVCGVETVEDINFFGITHIQWLKQYLVLPHGIPSADTILRVLARIDHAKFKECFANWTRGYFKGRVQPGPVIAIAGDIIRGKGDYVLSLKENHPETYVEAAALFPEKELGGAGYRVSRRTGLGSGSITGIHTSH